MLRMYAYRFRIYPTPAQEILIAKTAGCVRWVYNYFVAKNRDAYREAKEQNKPYKRPSGFDMDKELTQLKKREDLAWLKEVDAKALSAACLRLDEAFKRCFKEKNGRPQFKDRYRDKTFTSRQNLRIEGDRLYIPKFKDGIKIRLDRPVVENIKQATVRRAASGRYYVSLLVERNIEPLPPVDKELGIDLGIKALATTSDGEVFENPKFYQSEAKRMRLLDKAVSRSQPGSKGRIKANRKRAKLHEKIANRRKHHLHQISRKLVNENQRIALENLHVKGMMANRKLAKAIGDCGWGELVRQVEYKAEWAGRKVDRVDRFYPSSKTCGNCQFVNKDLQLSDRVWTCPKCGTKHDRDVNAAKNILKQGKKS